MHRILGRNRTIIFSNSIATLNHASIVESMNLCGRTKRLPQNLNFFINDDGKQFFEFRMKIMLARYGWRWLYVQAYVNFRETGFMTLVRVRNFPIGHHHFEGFP